MLMTYIFTSFPKYELSSETSRISSFDGKITSRSDSVAQTQSLEI